MAGQGDASHSKPEDIIAKGLMANNAGHTDNLNEYRQSNPPGNADKPGSPEVKQPAQAGGPAAPPEAAAKPAGDKPAAPAAGADKGAPPKDAGDKGHTEVVVSPKALDVMKQVNGILDGDVPRLNKAHDLDGAKQAYEKAIAAAKQLTPDDLAKAQKDLVEVRKEKAAEKDPAKQRELANKEVELYTITRLKDAALGNMALWYYRQGKTEDGNEKLLEASGVDPAKAHDLRKLTDNDIKQYGAVLTSGDGNNIAPILGDANFYRQINKIKESGVDVPPIFGQVHDAVVAHAADVAKANGDKTAAPGDNSAAAAAPVDAKQIQADIDSFKTLSQQLDKAGGPLSAEQKAALEKGIKAFDQKNLLIGQMMDTSQKNLDTLIPHDKQQAFGAAQDKINDELTKIAQANKGALPDDLQKNIAAMVDTSNPTAYKAAADALTKSNPDLAAALKQATDLLPADKKDGMAAMKAYSDTAQLTDAFIKSSTEQTFAHYEYAKLLVGQKNPPDAADLAQAKQVMGDGFKNIPKDVYDLAMKQPDIKKLADQLTATGDQGTATAGADNKGDKPGAPAAGDSSTLANMSPQDLQTQLDAAIKKGSAGMKDAKALYEEEIRRAENPEMISQVNQVLKSNLDQLEKGKDASGNALDANARAELHKNNVAMLGALNAASQLHSEYAMYLGDGRLNLNPDDAHAKLTPGLNQLKSMDAQQRLAIAAADKVDITLLQRADAALNADRKAGIGDSKNLNDLKVQLEGGKASDGSEFSGMLNQRVALRDQLAALYLTQGMQFKADGSPMASIMPKDHVTDALFKPQEALKLLTEAKAANEVANGKGAHDQTTESLFAMGQQLQPEMFKNNSDRLRETGANVVSDMSALGTSAMAGMAIRFALGAATDGRINPMAANAAADVTAIGTGIATRHLVHGYLTGKSESWSDSALHGTAAALMPIGFRYSAQFLSSNKMAQTVLNGRSSLMTTESVLERASSSVGKDATFAQTARVLENSGLKNEAAVLEKFGSRPFSSATPEELAEINKAINFNGARGRDALARILPQAERSAQDGKIIEALQSRGIHSAADLDAQLQARAARVTALNDQVQSAGVAGLKDSQPVTDALRKMTGPDNKLVYGSKEALDAEAKFLAENNIKTVGQLRTASGNAGKFFTVENMFPELHNASAASIREAAASGANVLGDAGSAGRAHLRQMLPEVHPTVNTSSNPLRWAGNKLAGGAGMVKDVLWDNRMWKVELNGAPVTFAGKAESNGLLASQDAASGWKAAAGRFKPEFNAPSMPNIGKLDPRFATADQLAVATSQNQFRTAAAAALAPTFAYNTITGEYDNWYKGKSYQDADGQYHQYTFMQAMADANLGGSHSDNMATRVISGTVGQALLGGFFLKGALPPALASDVAPAATKGVGAYINRMVPQLAAGREATVGGGAFVKSMAGYAAFGNPNTYTGAMGLMEAADKQRTYDSTQAPLQDYAPDDIGTAVDNVSRPAADSAPAAAPTGDAVVAPPPAPAASDSSAAAPPAAADSTAAAPPAQSAPKPAAKPAGQPAPGASGIGADQPPPGQ